MGGIRYSKKDCYKQAVQLDPKLAKAWFNLDSYYGRYDGHTWEDPNTWVKKREQGYCFEKALNLDPKNAEVWEFMGHVGCFGHPDRINCVVSGREYSRNMCFKQALKLDPTNATA